jgi:hypothetical protein
LSPSHLQSIKAHRMDGADCEVHKRDLPAKAADSPATQITVARVV